MSVVFVLLHFSLNILATNVMYIKTTKKLIFTIENTKNISRQKNKKNEPKHKITKKIKEKKYINHISHSNL